MVLAQMRRHLRWLLPAVLLGGLFGGACAQGRAQAVDNLSTMPALGSFASPTGMFMGGGRKAHEEDPPLAIRDTFVTFIDGATPRNVVGIRFDALYRNRQPMRAEYYHPSGGVPGATGFPLPETRIDYQDLTSFAEYSVLPWFSIFMEVPYRWLNPEVNRNDSGASDLRYGLKLCTWSSDDLIATILLRLYQDSARHESLGAGHWSIEPGLLLAYRFNDMILVEGEFRYWTALTSNDFAGNLLRYGLGVSYGQRSYGFWYMPVLEGVGWSVLDGKTMLATSASSFEVQDAHGQTIFNAYLGMRVGYGPNLDFYAGYGRSFTGHFWQRDIYRFELRFSY